MRRCFLLLVLFLAAATIVCIAQPARRRKHKAASVAQPPVQPVQPAPVHPPPPPPTPENGPSLPPDVTFHDDLLTITARNSTLTDVMNAVKQKTGALVDMPLGSNDRVVGKFGPGAPRDVMAQLLNGSRYDYVLLGSASDPAALKHIVLVARAVGPEQPQTSQQTTQPLQAVPQVDNDQTDPNADIVPEQSMPEQEQPDQPEQAEQPEQPEQPDLSQPPPPGVAPGVKTPQELLRELQEQQRQQQQQNGDTERQER